MGFKKNLKKNKIYPSQAKTEEEEGVSSLKKRKKAFFKRKKEKNHICYCKHKKGTQKQVSNSIDFDIIGDEFDRVNWRLIHGEAKEIAQYVWDLGKGFGIIHKGEEGEIVQKLDVGVSRGHGSNNSSKVVWDKSF